MGVFFVINPAAGRGRSRRIWNGLQAELKRSTDWKWAFTDAPGHATELARQAAAAGFDRVAALGGDGTVREVLDGIVGTTSALAVVPSGTGNDYCRTVHIPTDPAAAVRLAFTGPTRNVDVGHIELTAGRSFHFLNVAGVGFDAEVAQSVNSFPKYLGGTVPYVLGILRTLWRYRPVDMNLHLDGTSRQRRSLMLAVSIAQYYGGGMRIAPAAVVDDGLFDVCIAGNLGRMEVLGLVPKIYSGGHVGHPKVEFHQCREVRIAADVPVAVHADGELLGHLPLTVRMRPQALRLVAPATGTGSPPAG